MKIEGIRYKYESGNLYGIIYRKKDNQEIAFLQFDNDRDYLENQLENIKPNENSTYEQIVDTVLDAYNY